MAYHLLNWTWNGSDNQHSGQYHHDSISEVFNIKKQGEITHNDKYKCLGDGTGDVVFYSSLEYKLHMGLAYIIDWFDL